MRAASRPPPSRDGEIGLQAARLSLEGRRSNQIVQLFWASSSQLDRQTAVPLPDIVQNSRLSNGYLPSLVQEVLLLEHGGNDVARQLLEVTTALRAVAPMPAAELSPSACQDMVG